MKPGFYWARFKEANNWQVVEIYRDYNSALDVLIIGMEDVYKINEFIFGPEIIQPEGLDAKSNPG